MPVNQLDQEPEATVNKFSLKVHHRDKKGRLLSKSPYTMYVRDGVQYFERPVGSGNLFYENNEPAGRIERKTTHDGKVVIAKFDFDAKHKDFEPPLSNDQRVLLELAEAKKRSEALEKELALIKAEQARKNLDKMSEKAKDAGDQDAVPRAEAVETKAGAKQIPQLRKS